MLAVAGQAPDSPEWAVEMKWDGVRAIVVCRQGTCRLYSRNRREITDSYPELVAALSTGAGDRELILDGEIIAQTAAGTPSFALLQRRMHVARPDRALLRAVPVQLFCFDVLVDDGVTVTGEPYLRRRERLDRLGFRTAPVQTPPHWVGISAEQMMAAARDNHLEGIVSKRIESVYRPGRRSPDWIKTPFRRTTEAVIAGWTSGSGSVAGSFGSLILGAHDRTGTLVHIGNVGTGFTFADRRSLRARLDELSRSDPVFPLAPTRGRPGTPHWVEPVLVGEVEYREYTGEGLRHPSWRGLRADKSCEEVVVPE